MDARGRESEPVCIDDEIPFEVPDGWEWARLESLIDLLSGVDLSPTEYNDRHKGIPYLTGASNFHQGRLLENRWTEHPKRESNKGDLLFTCKGTVGEMAINCLERAHIARQIMAIRPTGDSYLPYLMIYLGSLVSLIKASAKGVIPGIERATLLSALVPVPPLAEQRRIAERVAELMPLVEEYGRLEDEREALDAALPERLRKSVLQEAVRGRLVPQDPDDEPASALLERIREERAKLVKEKKIRAPKGGESVIYLGSDGRRYEKRVDAKGRESEPICIDDEIPFDIPGSWEWARLEDACTVVVDCPHSTPKYLDYQTGHFAIDTNCIDDEWGLTGLRALSKEAYETRTARYVPKAGDLVFTREGSIGRSYILNENNVCLGQRVMLISCSTHCLDSRYCQIVLSSPYAWSLYKKENVGTGVKHINVSMVRRLLVPLPPLEEQKRVVLTVTNLLGLITNR